MKSLSVVWFLSAGALIAGCFSPTLTEGLPCTESGKCPDGLICTTANECRSSEPESDAGAEVPLDCEPREVSCTGELLTECNDEGTGAIQTECPAGCNESEPRCNRVRFANGLDTYLLDAAAAGDFALATGATFNTTTGVVLAGDGSPVSIPFVEHSQADESLIAVFLASSLTISGDVEFTGNKVAALVVDGAVEIQGSVTINPQFDRSCSLFFFSMAEESLPGTPGGSLGARGGNGGASATDPSTEAALPQPFAFEPLLPGCAGVGYETPGSEDDGGRGGGALQISSSSSVQLQESSVAAGGAGGPDFFNTIGFGGGSGGVVHIEAPAIRMLGQSGVYANGGGGGCVVNVGQPGRPSLFQAAGGSCASEPSNGNGGAGGTITSAARFGGSGTGTGDGGGGGGSVGVIQFTSLTQPSISIETELSPTPTQRTLAIE